MADLSGKVILITGGAQGIGAATAIICAQRGAAVIISDILQEQGNATVEEVVAAGGTARFVATDVRSDPQVKALLQTVHAAYGKLDGVVCAAGVLRGASETPEELTLEDFDLVMDVNIRGVFLLAKYATPLLEASQGVMIVVASPAGVTGSSSSLAYGASKGGANGLAMTLAGHLSKRHIRVNTIYPGEILTQLKLDAELSNARRSGMTEEEVHKRAHDHYGQPEGVAKVIAFMLSDDADYLRGGVFTR